MKTLYLKIILPLLMLCVTAAPLHAEEAATAADEIMLKNGSRIIGTVVEVRDGSAKVETDFAGTLAIALDQIVSMRTTESVVLQMTDDTVLEDQTLTIVDNQLQVVDASGASQSLALEQLAIVNPQPWEMGHGYDWTGLVNFAMRIEKGNSDTEELDYRLESVWRSDDDRYTLKFYGEIDEANDVKSADNWTIIGKYDYFFSERTYWGVNAYAEADEFADLDLRYYIGPYIGREFLTDPLLSLSAEVGASYVNEDFSTAPDQDYPGANWGVHMASNYLGGDSRLYFDQLGVWNLDETSDIIVNTTLGLAFPLLWGFEAAAEILWEYDSGAVEGVEKMDETYAFRLGYTW
ncbi:hypothetical protein A3709_07200 [Halioglobus sp. HI00S01]|uniref:DUF481 domain-containing protein n=1 Tax=Halioglobus sp. HI00S01 TaxID=1822214 RepID=UPI0007C21DEB|nr:DUF481 domain-containing protein [Halioglobus sp. HI00S01]KZX56165.1 hypothetical protein A3709_07200 [Halioglobus sp. HI00S01]